MSNTLTAVYTKCHHGNLVKDCLLCQEEKQKYKSLLSQHQATEKDKRIPIYRGCSSGSSGCFCSGRCKEIIGYYE
jgi:hypothetical protein